MILQLKQQFLDLINDKDKLHAFVTGDFVATIITTFTISEIDWIHPALKLVFIAVGGVVGGFCSPIGRRIYNWFEKKYDNK